MEAPTVASYICSVTISTIPKFFIILVASAVAAYRVELYSALTSTSPMDDEVPKNVCAFTNTGDDYRGDRICNNAVAAAVCSVIVATVLMIIDLLVPCIDKSFSILASLFNILWATLMAAHWLVTGALLADLYRKYCNDRTTNECNETDRRFTALTVMSFVCAAGWGIVVGHSLLRLCFCKPQKGKFTL